MEDRVRWRKEFIENSTTRQLLGYLNGARKCGGAWSPCDGVRGTYLTIEELKAELALRPHVPNKKEAKQLRREAQKRGR